MLVTRIGFDVFSESTPRSIEVDSPPAICRLRRCEPDSLPICRKTKGSVSARFSERLLVMVVVVVVVNTGEVADQVLNVCRQPGGGHRSDSSVCRAAVPLIWDIKKNRNLSAK